MIFDTVCIVGVGLIGGSFGMALRKRKLARRVIGAVRRPESIRESIAQGAVDDATLSLEEAVRDANLILIATPVGRIAEKCRAMSAFVRNDAIITDAGSTKSALVKECTPIFTNGAQFVGSHPMAGSERTGVANSDADLFEKATWILTPTVETPQNPIQKLQELVEAIGARSLMMNPAVHDELIAVTSHLPHITATLLVHLFAQEESNHSVVNQLIAGGWRDGTRVAAGSPEMWRDICLSNADAIIENIDRVIAEANNVRDLLKNNDEAALYKWFADAATARRKQ